MDEVKAKGLFSMPSNSKTHIWSVLTKNLSSNHWRLAEHHSGWLVSAHTVTTASGKVAHQLVLSNAWETEEHRVNQLHVGRRQNNEQQYQQQGENTVAQYLGN